MTSRRNLSIASWIIAGTAASALVCFLIFLVVPRATKEMPLLGKFFGSLAILFWLFSAVCVAKFRRFQRYQTTLPASVASIFLATPPCILSVGILLSVFFPRVAPDDARPFHLDRSTLSSIFFGLGLFLASFSMIVFRLVHGIRAYLHRKRA